MHYFNHPNATQYKTDHRKSSKMTGVTSFLQSPLDSRGNGNLPQNSTAARSSRDGGQYVSSQTPNTPNADSLKSQFLISMNAPGPTAFIFMTYFEMNWFYNVFWILFIINQLLVVKLLSNLVLN